MTARKPSSQVAAANYRELKATHYFSSYDWDLKRVLMTCLALGLLGGLVTTTAVAMIAYLLLTNSRV